MYIVLKAAEHVCPTYIVDFKDVLDTWEEVMGVVLEGNAEYRLSDTLYSGRK